MHHHVYEAQDILRSLGLPAEQTNQRSALTLLALLELTPERPWSDAENPMRGVTPIMDWMARNYLSEPYAPNTRETIRRRTLHQFIAAGVALHNPDDPSRPVNSPHNCYQVPLELLSVVRQYGGEHWEAGLAEWQAKVPALRQTWAAEREMAMIPVTLPDGSVVALSGGGQNQLIAEVLAQFCERFTPGGHVLYLGDAGEKYVVDHRDILSNHGIVIDDHGKMPDLVIHLEDRGWLVLIEAVTSHGPIDSLRKADLENLFASRLGLVFVTTFPDRATYASYLKDVAWETDVWLADSPSHLIHHNGERFLGPY